MVIYMGLKCTIVDSHLAEWGAVFLFPSQHSNLNIELIVTKRFICKVDGVTTCCHTDSYEGVSFLNWNGNLGVQCK